MTHFGGIAYVARSITWGIWMASMICQVKGISQQNSIALLLVLGVEMAVENIFTYLDKHYR